MSFTLSCLEAALSSWSRLQQNRQIQAELEYARVLRESISGKSCGGASALIKGGRDEEWETVVRFSWLLSVGSNSYLHLPSIQRVHNALFMLSFWTSSLFLSFSSISKNISETLISSRDISRKQSVAHRHHICSQARRISSICSHSLQPYNPNSPLTHVKNFIGMAHKVFEIRHRALAERQGAFEGRKSHSNI